jgi:AraC-like DNA-binding protein
MSPSIEKPFLEKKQHASIYRRHSNLDFPPHLHNAVEMVMMRRGHSTALYEGRRIPLSEGDLFLAFPDRIHGYENTSDGESIVFIIPLHPYLSDFREILEQKLPVDPVLHKGEWEHSGVSALLEMAMEDRLGRGSKETHGYAMLIVAKILPLLKLRDAPSSGGNALQSLLSYINRNYTRPLTRGEVAAAVGYNESYISHLFSDALHTTLTDYINALRMDDAFYLLSDTDLAVSRIAEDLGFGSLRSFNRIFLKHAQMTPSDYRTCSRLRDENTLPDEPR